MKSIFNAAYDCIICNDIDEKLTLTKDYFYAWQAGNLNLDDDLPLVSIQSPGQPSNLQLVAPIYVPKRKLHSEAGLMALLHAIAHIEFNAINLAWDAIYRFRDLPEQFYQDWLQVAAEEAQHFSLIRTQLQIMGAEYGELTAHNGLWEMAVETEQDVMLRMALVPRVLEARGLDATPKIISKLQQFKQDELVKILNIILHDEIGHVAKGSYWFNNLCKQRGLEPSTKFKQILMQHYRGQIRGPFNIEARLAAGFSSEELDELQQQQS